jgi:integrase
LIFGHGGRPVVARALAEGAENVRQITNKMAEVVEPSDKRQFLWDGEIRGFGLRTMPSGLKTWVVKYRAEGGGRTAPVRWYTIGNFPLIGAKVARAETKGILAKVRFGEDPMGDLATRRREMLVSQLLDLYEQEGCVVQRGIRKGTSMKPLTKRYTMARLRNHVLPLLGRKKVTTVKSSDIEALVRAIESGKTAKDEVTGPRTRIIVKGGEGAARKVVRDLSAVFAFAHRRDIVPANPVTTASVRKTDNRRERFLTTSEIQRLGKALRELEETGANPKAINIAHLWALTGCRRNEIAGLKWSEVDFDLGVFAFEDSKTGKSIRPLPSAAASLLAALRKNADPEATYVFPAERGSGFYQGTKPIWAQAIKLADLPGVTPHILRHTLGSLAASSGQPLLMVGAMLGHTNARSTQIYAHIAHDPARLAADRVSSPIAEALRLKAADG